jgi:hypothetical protein
VSLSGTILTSRKVFVAAMKVTSKPTIDHECRARTEFYCWTLRSPFGLAL